ncbi:Rha family transcriptional regulator [Aeromonas hydrophila]|uniref:Rha family transcriptional regulator n=1 Tax=Aeromonas hydrophila TaxID=644 RepID=UPI00227A0006|nr:Rha family transcriptional regulator [Aeromonas hydrophila]WAG17127.1 Rha family transcriptional regulator [Aeromonas hydrophila]
MNTITSFTPAEIISLHQGQPVTTSLKVAEVFGKQHKDVLRKIATLDCSKDFNERNFALVTYQDGKGEARPAYEMTKDGFIFVVMGFTGAKAAATKEAYINAFNWMAEQLAAQRPQPAICLTDDELCTLTWCWRAADRMMEAARSIYPLLEVAEHRDAGRYYSIIHEYPYTLNQTRKILADRTRHIQPNTHGESDWPKLIPHLRRDQLTIGWCR